VISMVPTAYDRSRPFTVLNRTLPISTVADVPREGGRGMARLVFGMNQSLDIGEDVIRLTYVPA
jgi:hypothetical protein